MNLLDLKNVRVLGTWELPTGPGGGTAKTVTWEGRWQRKGQSKKCHESGGGGISWPQGRKGSDCGLMRKGSSRK